MTTQRGGDPAATFPQDDEWFTHPVPRRPADDAPYMLGGVGSSGSPSPDALSVDAVDAVDSVRAVAHGAGTPWTPPGSTRAERRRAREAAEAAADAALPPVPAGSGSGPGSRSGLRSGSGVAADFGGRGAAGANGAGVLPAPIAAEDYRRRAPETPQNHRRRAPEVPEDNRRSAPETPQDYRRTAPEMPEDNRREVPADYRRRGPEAAEDHRRRAPEPEDYRRRAPEVPEDNRREVPADYRRRGPEAAEDNRRRAPEAAEDWRTSTMRWDGPMVPDPPAEPRGAADGPARREPAGAGNDWRDSTMRWDGLVEDRLAPAEDWRASTMRWEGVVDETGEQAATDRDPRWNGGPGDHRSATADPRRDRWAAGGGDEAEPDARRNGSASGGADERGAGTGARRDRWAAGDGEEQPGAGDLDPRWNRWASGGGDEQPAPRRRRRAARAQEPVEATAFDPGNTGTWRVRDVVPGADGGRRTTIILRYLLGLLAVDHVRALTRWAYALPILGLILLAVHPRWIGLAVLVLGILLLVGRAVAVRLIARRTLPRRYRPIEDDLRAAVEAGKANLRGELRRVGMPSSALTLPRSVFRADSRSAARSRLRDIEIDRVLPRAQLDRALRVLDEAPSPGR